MDEVACAFILFLMPKVFGEGRSTMLWAAACEDHAVTSDSAMQGSGDSEGRKTQLKTPSRGSPDVKERLQGGSESLHQSFHPLECPAQESRLQSCQSD